MADIDDDTGEIVLVVHWKGGWHKELRVKKPKTGEHNAHTSEEALGIIREIAGRWSDESIAACLNRMVRARTGTQDAFPSIRSVRTLQVADTSDNIYERR